MIDRREILDMAARVSLIPHIVEKDYALGWLVAGIYAHEELKDKWLFKGGTCLKKCFFETYRFSEDLDFTLLDAAHLEEGFLKRVFAEVGAWVYNESGIEVPADKQDFELFQNPRGNLSCQGKVSYRGPISSRDLPRIKLDLTADERVVRPPQHIRIYHPYSDEPAEGIEVLAYDYIEAFAEKFRALAERTRPRDLYDVVQLYRNVEARPGQVEFLAVLREKCTFKGIEIPRIADLELHRNDLEAGWQHMLAHQLPALLPVQSFWDELPSLFDWLHGAAQPPTMPAFPMGAGETIIRERALSPSLGITRQSHIETIRFAAANRLVVDLDYQAQDGVRSKRAIEAYSLRRSRAGDVLLMAVREADAQPRSYRVDNILGAAVTQRNFTPRYPIELTPTASQIISPMGSNAGIAPLRRASSFGGVSTGPSYVYRCSVCGREFARKTHDATLRPHKNKGGYDCYGRYGIYARTKY